jgi:hypothetical protein
MHLTTNENLKERIASVKRSIAAGHFLPYEMRGVRAALWSGSCGSRRFAGSGGGWREGGEARRPGAGGV